jgi:hypothetical protein
MVGFSGLSVGWTLQFVIFLITNGLFIHSFGVYPDKDVLRLVSHIPRKNFLCFRQRLWVARSVCARDRDLAILLYPLY